MAKPPTLPVIECRDCWSEALADLGIYGIFETVPKDKIKAAKESYENWFYQSHDVEKRAIVAP